MTDTTTVQEPDIAEEQADVEMNELMRKAARFEACEAQVVLVEEAKEEWDDTKAAASEAKKKYEVRLEDLVAMIQERPPAAPLFDQDAEDPEAWKNTPLEDIDISERICGILSEQKKIITVGELSNFQASVGTRWAEEITGIGTETQTEIEDRLASFWEAHEAEKIDGEPEQEPDEPVEGGE